MLPRTGSTFTGEFGLSPGIVPAPASPPLSVCAEPRTGEPSEPTSTARTNHLPRIAGSRARLRRRLQLLPVLGIHRLGAAARGVERNLVVVAELVEIRIGPGQQMRDHPARTIDLRDDAARIGRHLLMQIELVIRRADERL